MSNAQFKRSEAEYHNEWYVREKAEQEKTRRFVLTDSIVMAEPTESKVSEQQAVGRAEHDSYDVVVLGAGHHGRNHPALRGVDFTGAKNIAFATPEMLGEIGREQAREDIAIIEQGGDLAEAKKLCAVLSIAGGKYGSRK